MEPQLSRSRECQRSDPPDLGETLEPISERQRLPHASGSQPPPEFWDNLSKIWLTKRALRELDRRNIQAARSLPRARASVPDTRNFIAESRNSKSIKLFASRGGPDLSDLRNFPAPIYSLGHTMNSNHVQVQSLDLGPTTTTTTTKTTGVYDRAFLQHLVDHKIYPSNHIHPDGSVHAKPTNWKDIHQRLTQPRPSLSGSRFTDEDYERFLLAENSALKEKQVSESVIPLIEGKTRNPKCRSGGIPFTNLHPLTDGTLKPGNPDIYYGARPEQLSRKVRDDLEGQIIPSTQHDLPIAPNFFLEVKGPDGVLARARRQACYDGALGARSMHSLQSYGQDNLVYDNNATAITSTYHGGNLTMYATHVAQPTSPGGCPGYHMTQLRSIAMIDGRDALRNGLIAYRNAKEWAEEQRNEAIRQANERAKRLEAGTPNGGASGNPALSFVTVVTEAEAEAQTVSHVSRTSLCEDSNALGDFQESDISKEDELADHKLPAKRPREGSTHQQTPRKRHKQMTRYSKGAG
ncbi:hypothetical protein K505DRAFT_354483 [Melanomma pulvis-pyrius CBS 109.77]|uniref:Uncharacterized protein n=1 Tax=Melanomma pulvis-pyrius CBS 109.77 TaxID=1314802 RepID=A0A6A6WR24_9PLEO|nr:hypothetical protein K505DRAFT_354483 [Melanomma pulvis-pyrius CBS 109.77]